MEQYRDDDWELQQALALSLQEFGVQSDTPPTTQPADGPLRRMVSPAELQGNDSSKSPAAVQKRRQKLPTFNPSDTEVEACFQELASANKAHINVSDLQKVAGKLGMPIDDQAAEAMLEYVAESQDVCAPASIRSGILDINVFKAIVNTLRIQ